MGLSPQLNMVNFSIIHRCVYRGFQMPRDYTFKKALPQSRYGRLTVISNAKGGWLCRCDCGNEKVVRTQCLKVGTAKSCGCLKAEKPGGRTTHGMTYKPIYRLWVSMVDRCYRENVPNFKFYGGRGIRVCDRWRTFLNFYADMGDRPEGCSLDRIDNAGNYEPSNCRWAPHTVQHANRRGTRTLTYKGKTQALADWSRETGVALITIRGRLNRGATPEAALQPVTDSRRPAIPIS